ncbi:restriction endonuclease subunit S [Mycobacteroides abscessus]|jgi:type I restriction modification DNA specificity domain protein|uniref:restriction endonuclease subunit S n=1 Tax=Streptococcus sp. oral taxon 061 TaxID=712623 RepID=UPI000926479C|nr:restriction endonuclease S subunit [Mycobacteroides abscessus subsp. abscessus]
MKKEKTPNIRFKKFEHNWFKDCLSKVSNSIEYGLNASAKDFDGIHKYLRITDIDDSSRLFLTDKLSSPDVNFTEEEYENYKLRINDLLFARTGASVGKTYLYRESDGEVYYAGFLIRARLHDSYDGNFIFQQTLTDKYKQFIEITSQRSGQPGVNGKEYGDWKIGMTSYPEQSAIGSLFRTLDDLLASYKNNLVNYQSLKVTMLSKMFPKVRQTVPEIRLNGFEGEWEVQALKELASFSKGNGYTKNDLVNSGKEIILYGRLYTNYQTVISKVNTFVTTVKINTVISKGGEVIVPASGETAEDISRASVVEKSGIILGGDLNIIYPDENKVNSIFLALTISNGSQQKELIKRAQGKSVVHLRNNDLEKVVLHYPSMEEQRAISAYFSNLDDLISDHQEKISQLETLKKKLLQDMFI